jgi:hypothetical protein
MREDVATAQEVVSRARELLAGSKSRMQRETLKVVIDIFGDRANKLSAGEPRNDCTCANTEPTSFDFSDGTS